MVPLSVMVQDVYTFLARCCTSTTAVGAVAIHSGFIEEVGQQ
jgi:hypothetical protein